MLHALLNRSIVEDTECDSSSGDQLHSHTCRWLLSCLRPTRHSRDHWPAGVSNENAKYTIDLGVYFAIQHGTIHSSICGLYFEPAGIRATAWAIHCYYAYGNNYMRCSFLLFFFPFYLEILECKVPLEFATCAFDKMPLS